MQVTVPHRPSHGPPVLLGLCLIGLSLPLLTRPAIVGAADEKPAPGASDRSEKGDADVGSVRRQTFKGFTYFYATTQTNLQDIGGVVAKLIPELHKAIADGNVQVAGPIVFIYHGATADPKAQFTLEIGMPVAEGAKAAGEFKIRQVPDYRCASVIYSGPLKGLSRAFEKLMPAVQEGPGMPTDEAREMYLYYDGPDSPNNVVHVSVGLK